MGCTLDSGQYVSTARMTFPNLALWLCWTMAPSMRLLGFMPDNPLRNGAKNIREAGNEGENKPDWYRSESRLTMDLLFIPVFTAPDFDTSQWTNVKETLGLDFPNVCSNCGKTQQHVVVP